MTDCVTHWKFQNSQIKCCDQTLMPVMSCTQRAPPLSGTQTQIPRFQIALDPMKGGLDSPPTRIKPDWMRQRSHLNGSAALKLWVVFAFLNKLLKNKKGLQVKYFIWDPNLHLNIVSLSCLFGFCKLLIILIILIGQLPGS